MRGNIQRVSGNIWYFHTRGEWIVVPTNGTVKKDGRAVMGRGIAKEAKRRFPALPTTLGDRLSLCGNIPLLFEQYRLITFPVKEVWWGKAKISLLDISCRLLNTLIDNYNYRFNITIMAKPRIQRVYLPKVGCGNGKLDWDRVKPVLDTRLDKSVCDYMWVEYKGLRLAGSQEV